jgi:hypothetical protein
LLGRAALEPTAIGMMAMLTRDTARCALVLGAGLLVACTDPVVGTWRAVNLYGFPTGKFTVDADLAVEGTLWLADQAGTAHACTFRGNVSEDGNAYGLQITFGGCDYCTSAQYECELGSDSGELGCAFCGGGYTNWEKE